MDELQAGVRVVDLLELDRVEVHAGHDLGQRLAVLELAAAQLGQAGHGADREVRGLGVDEVDLGSLRQQVDDDLLGRFLPGAGVQDAEVLGRRIDGQDALDERLGAARS